MRSSEDETSSAAMEGVGARMLAARSESMVSTSWPTAEMMKMGEAWIAWTACRDEKPMRSSNEPPPRPTIRTSSGVV